MKRPKVQVDIELYEDLIDDAVERLQEYIVNNNLEDRTYLEVFGGSRIATREIELLPLSLPYKTRGDKQRFSKVSEEYSDMVSFRVYGQDAFGLNFTGPRDLRSIRQWTTQEGDAFLRACNTGRCKYYKGIRRYIQRTSISCGDGAGIED